MSKFYYKRDTEVQFKRVPQFNLIPKNGIKCAQCHLIYMPEQIQEHLITHILPKYLTPHPQNSGAKKLSALINLTDTTLSVSSDIASLNVQGFPRQQNIRKNIQPPSQFAISAHDIQHRVGQRDRDIISYKVDNKQLTSHIGGQYQKDYAQLLTLTKNIDLTQQSASFNFNPQISMYKRSKISQLSMLNDKIKARQKKNPFQSDNVSQRSQQYRIYQISDQVQNLSQKSQSNALVVKLKKHKDRTPHYNEIDTSSKKQRRDHQKAMQQWPVTPPHKDNKYISPKDKLDSTIYGTMSRRKHPHQCQDCHGFYCQTCHSTIPPQYRPWNLKDIDPKISSFYKQHVYKGQCKQCQGQMVNGRQPSNLIFTESRRRNQQQ